MVLVCGESGSGKTTFVDRFLHSWAHAERIRWAACDPLPTPRPLGPFHDLAADFAESTREALSHGPFEICAAVFGELAAQPTILVIDDLHWADQATVDLLRLLLRRIGQTNSLVIGIVRDNEMSTTHPMRLLLGDVAQSRLATSITLPPLSLAAVTELIGDRHIDPLWLHRTTGGNAFFVFEMLDHSGDELPASVRDSILSRTVGLDADEWDLLHLLACAPGPIPGYLIAHLGITESTLRTLHEANFVRRSDRGLAFRHDLCRLAIASVMPPGAETAIHRRMILAYQAAAQGDPAVLTHHAVRAGDPDLTRLAAADAGRVAARSGAHTEAADFYEIALTRGGPAPSAEAELLELLADECYLTDRLPDAIAARRRALQLRQKSGAWEAASGNHHALAVYESHNTNLSAAEHHAAQSVSVLEATRAQGGSVESALLGQALTTQAYFAVLGGDLQRAATLVYQAAESAAVVGEPALNARVALIEGYRGVLAGDEAARERMLSSIRSAADLFEDEVYSQAATSLAFLDIEQRRFDRAAEVLEAGLALTEEREIALGRSWLVGMRSRLRLLVGNWDDALADTSAVLDGPSTPLARMLPLVVRAVIALRRDGARLDGIDHAWQALSPFGEHLRCFTATAIAERAWLTGIPDDRLDACRALLDSSRVPGLPMAAGELALWLRNLDPSFDTDRDVGPTRLALDGSFESAADEFNRLAMPYEAALCLVQSGDADLIRRGLDGLDRLGAAAVAAKVRRDLRAGGMTVVPARRTTTTLHNPAGLTTRQTEVLRLMHLGLTYAEVAARLQLSVKTVEHHVSAVISKLGAANRRDAVRRARELGMLGEGDA